MSWLPKVLMAALLAGLVPTLIPTQEACGQGEQRKFGARQILKRKVEWNRIRNYPWGEALQPESIQHYFEEEKSGVTKLEKTLLLLDLILEVSLAELGHPIFPLELAHRDVRAAYGEAYRELDVDIWEGLLAMRAYFPEFTLVNGAIVMIRNFSGTIELAGTVASKIKEDPLAAARTARSLINRGLYRVERRFSILFSSTTTRHITRTDP